MSKLNIKTRTIFCLDNLQVLERLNSDCVDLIYLDPPFSKNDTWLADNDKKINEIKKWFLNHQKDGHFGKVDFRKMFQSVSYKDIWTKDDIKDIHFTNLAKNRPQLAEFLSSVQLVNKSKFLLSNFYGSATNRMPENFEKNGQSLSTLRSRDESSLEITFRSYIWRKKL